jgi:hypothetical protein
MTAGNLETENYCVVSNSRCIYPAVVENKGYNLILSIIVIESVIEIKEDWVMPSLERFNGFRLIDSSKGRLDWF